MKTSTYRRVSVVACVFWLLGATALPAFAHAALLSSTLRDGDTFATMPDTATFTFSETVMLPRDAVRLFDAAARPIPGVVATGDGPTITVSWPDLPDGAYLATLTVVSQDGHQVVTPVRFVVGNATLLDTDQSDGLVSSVTRDPTRPVVAGLRAVAYLAALLGWGFVWLGRRMLPAATYPAAVTVARRFALAGAVASAVAAGVVGWWLYAPATVSDLIGLATADATGGFVWRTAGFLFLAVTLTTPVARVAAATVLLGYVFDGHQLTFGDRLLMMVGDAAHLLAGGVWLGGVWLIWWLWRRDAAAVRPAVAVFGLWAAVTAAVTVAAGVAMASQLVDGPSALITTSYGRMLAAKLAAVVAIGVVSFTLRRAFRRRDSDVTGLRSRVRTELVAFATVLTVTAVLVGVNPQGAADVLTAYRTPLGENTLEMVVEPDVGGIRVVHAYLVDASGGFAPVSELSVDATFRTPDGTTIGPLAIPMAWVADGHFLAATDRLTFAGTWEFQVVAPSDRFTLDTATLKVVAP